MIGGMDVADHHRKLINRTLNSTFTGIRYLEVFDHRDDSFIGYSRTEERFEENKPCWFFGKGKTLKKYDYVRGGWKHTVWKIWV